MKESEMSCLRGARRAEKGENRPGPFVKKSKREAARVDPGGFRETKRVITRPRASTVSSNPPTPFS